MIKTKRLNKNSLGDTSSVFLAHINNNEDHK
jgi:hypothetical protein